MQLLSLIIPVYNEEKSIGNLLDKIKSSIATIDMSVEVIFIDDGSKDKTIEKVLQYPQSEMQIQVIKLSRNFGKESATTAGLYHSKGDAIILLDADLQDPPELIKTMIDKWRQGYLVVNMKRHTRGKESIIKRLSATFFYYLMQKLADISIPSNTGDFRLLDRIVVDVINRMPEKSRYMKGLMSWPGFNTYTMEFDRDSRHTGSTKWKFSKLLVLAIDGIVSFSAKPLRIASIIGLLVSLFAISYGAVIIYKTLMFGIDVSGYPSLMVAILGLGGIQLLTIGIVGEYLGRVFTEVKNRPTFVVEKIFKKGSDN